MAPGAAKSLLGPVVMQCAMFPAAAGGIAAG